MGSQTRKTTQSLQKTAKSDDTDLLDEEGSEEEYEVEAIEDHRRKPRKKLEYLLKWKGFEERTWESEDNVNAEELIKNYWDKLGGEATKETAKKTTKAGTTVKKERKSTEPDSKKKSRKRARLDRSVSLTRDSYAENDDDSVNNSDTGVKDDARRSSSPLTLHNSDEPVPDHYRADWDWGKNALTVMNVWRDPGEDPNSELYVKVQWSDNTCVWHRNKVVREKCPGLLLTFYESRLKFQPDA